MLKECKILVQDFVMRKLDVAAFVGEEREWRAECDEADDE